MIKKIILCLTLLAASQWGISQNVDNLFSEFSKANHAQTVNVGQLMMTMVKPFCKEAKGISSIQVVDLSECSSDVKVNFANKVKKIADSDYETMVSSNEDGEHTRILVLIKNETICELLVLTTGKGNAMVRVKGALKQSDLASLIQKEL